MMGLALHERAAFLGLSCRDLIALSGTDPRITAPDALATDGAVARLRRWLDAGRPDADVRALRFVGSDDVHAIVLDTLSKMPAPVRWHGVRHVVWIEVGRGNGGWMSEMPLRPDVDGDQAHLIALAGDRPDAVLPGYTAHELAHSWRRAISANPKTQERISDREHDRRLLSVIPAEEILRRRYREETMADRLAEIWGFRVHGNTNDPGLGHAMRARLAEVEAEVEPQPATEPGEP